MRELILHYRRYLLNVIFIHWRRFWLFATFNVIFLINATYHVLDQIISVFISFENEIKFISFIQCVIIHIVICDSNSALYFISYIIKFFLKKQLRISFIFCINSISSSGSFASNESFLWGIKMFNICVPTIVLLIWFVFFLLSSFLFTNVGSSSLSSTMFSINSSWEILISFCFFDER